MKITQSLLTRYQEAVGDYNCPGRPDDDVAAEAGPAASGNSGFVMPPADKGKLRASGLWKGVSPIVERASVMCMCMQ